MVCTSNPIPQQYFLSVTDDLGAQFHVFGLQWDQRILGFSIVLQNCLFNLFQVFQRHLDLVSSIYCLLFH